MTIKTTKEEIRKAIAFEEYLKRMSKASSCGIWKIALDSMAGARAHGAGVYVEMYRAMKKGLNDKGLATNF